MNRTRLYLLITLVTAIAGQTLVACKENEAPVFERSVIWKQGEEGAEGYRIPGVVATGKGTVLIFSEERPEYGDAAVKSLVVKRSLDNGLTWSDNIYIERCDGSYWKENASLVDPEDVPNKKEVWTNPAVVLDKHRGRVFFFYALSEGTVGGRNLQRYTRVFYRYSDDEGLTWSDRRDVTDLLNVKADGTPNLDESGKPVTDENGFACDYLGRAFHMPGPGHGIQLKDGRLLLQMWNRKALGVAETGIIPVAERKYGLSVIYSDDHGETWKYGSAFGDDGWNMGECRMAELDNGDIYLNSRYTTETNNHRAIAISRDRGVTFTDLRIDKSFPLSRSCDAGLTTVRWNGQQYLLYSKNESAEGRKNLVVRASTDGGHHWTSARIVDEGFAGYSDMTVLPDNTILLAYETERNRPVYCVRFNLEWLLNSKLPATPVEGSSAADL